MPEHWTPEELRAYERAIKRAPKSQMLSEKKRQRKIDKLFDRLHGDQSIRRTVDGIVGSLDSGKETT